MMKEKKYLIYAVGLGPGKLDLMTERAVKIIKNCDVICGYKTYIEQIKPLLDNKEIISNGMTGEIERCKQALDATLQGKKVAVVSSGDAGVFGMAGLLLELTETVEYQSIDVEAIVGVTASSAAAAILGAPLMNDYAVISLSNLMTPENIILKRLHAVAAAEMVCAIYNPASKKRQQLIRDAVKIFSDSSGEDTFAAIVTNAERTDEEVVISRLKDFPFEKVSMTSLVIIGNKDTILRSGKLYTLRGYRDKYKI